MTDLRVVQWPPVIPLLSQSVIRQKWWERDGGSNCVLVPSPFSYIFIQMAFRVHRKVNDVLNSTWKTRLRHKYELSHEHFKKRPHDKQSKPLLARILDIVCLLLPCLLEGMFASHQGHVFPQGVGWDKACSHHWDNNNGGFPEISETETIASE